MIPDNVNVALLAISSLVSVIVVPVLTNFLTAKNASGAVKQAVAGGLSLVVAILAVLIANSFDLTNLSATILLVLWAAKAGYEIFNKLIEPAHEVGPQLGKPD
jgi:steroid 5-alpha reductase family enzyme